LTLDEPALTTRIVFIWTCRRQRAGPATRIRVEHRGRTGGHARAHRVALAIALSITLDLSGKGVALVGEIATGLPTVVLPDVRGMVSEGFALSAIGIFVVSFISGIVTARSFATRNRYRIDADRELIGFGAANVAAGLFGGFPVTGADSRTAINDALGGKTQVAGLVAAGSLAFSLLFLTRLLAHLPLAALGAVLASAAVDLFDLGALIKIWRINRIEFAALIAIPGWSRSSTLR
jgi:MFS superfamily sulfate permease-like transporter